MMSSSIPASQDTNFTGTGIQVKTDKGPTLNKKSGQPRKAHKCSICGEAGHYKSRCPMKPVELEQVASKASKKDAKASKKNAKRPTTGSGDGPSLKKAKQDPTTPTKHYTFPTGGHTRLGSQPFCPNSFGMGGYNFGMGLMGLSPLELMILQKAQLQRINASLGWY